MIVPRLTAAQWLRFTGALLAVATISALFFYRTDPDLVSQKVAQPYAAISILPDSLEQRLIPASRQWGLFYSIRALKPTTCAEVRIDRIVQKIGDAFPLANNSDISGETIPASHEEQIVPGLLVRLSRPLGPGDYFLLIKATCYLDDPTTAVKVPLAPPAEAFICFRVPDTGLDSRGQQRLQPISENCDRELSDIVLMRPEQLSSRSNGQ